MKMWRSKYGNKKTIVDGHKFDSKKEADYYVLLKSLEIDGKVSDIVLQPVFLLLDSFVDSNGNARRKIEYKADFSYYDRLVEETIVVDVKGMLTDVYKLKLKMFLSKYPEIHFMEV
jgi:hypothetical protein